MAKNLPADILQHVAAGDGRAMELLDKAYRTQLTVYAYRCLADWHTAEDIVQEVLLHLWGCAGEVRSLNAWLYQATRNDIRDWIRKRKTEPTKDNELARFPAPDHETSVLDRVEIAEILPKLTPRQRDCLLLAADGYKGEEIAKRLGIGHVSVRTTLHDIRCGRWAKPRVLYGPRKPKPDLRAAGD